MQRKKNLILPADAAAVAVTAEETAAKANVTARAETATVMVAAVPANNSFFFEQSAGRKIMMSGELPLF